MQALGTAGVKIVDTHGETRTRNLRFRRPTPYPLGHAGVDISGKAGKIIQILDTIFHRAVRLEKNYCSGSVDYPLDYSEKQSWPRG